MDELPGFFYNVEKYIEYSIKIPCKTALMLYNDSN